MFEGTTSFIWVRIFIEVIQIFWIQNCKTLEIRVILM